jgi:hypothetical protein
VRYVRELKTICWAGNYGTRDVRRRQSEPIKFRKKHCTRNWIESVARIEINDINLRVGMYQGSIEFKISNKICRYRFRFDESMLMRIKFGLQMA